MKVNILGTEYSIEYKTDAEVADDMSLGLRECDGYCDSTKGMIVIAEKDSFDLDDEAKGKYVKTHLREAIITAFANETSKSGLSEETIEWIALQFPKMVKAFKEVGAIEGCKCNKHLSYEELEKSRQLFEKANDATFDRFIDKFLEE